MSVYTFDDDPEGQWVEDDERRHFPDSWFTPLACETGNAILGVFWGLLITTAVVGAGVLVWMVA
jgi:hypothetical protein